MLTRSRQYLIGALLAAAIALAGLPAPAAAQGFLLVDLNQSSTNVTLTTTTEKDVIASNVVNLQASSAQVLVLCYAQLTTGADTTTVTPTIRRGTGIAGTVINEVNVETITAAAGSTQAFFWMGTEQRSAGALQYSCTLDQAGASADGTSLFQAIAVMAR